MCVIGGDEIFANQILNRMYMYGKFNLVSLNHNLSGECNWIILRVVALICSMVWFRYFTLYKIDKVK